MNTSPLLDTIIALFALGILISIGSHVTLLIVSLRDQRRNALPRAIACADITARALR